VVWVTLWSGRVAGTSSRGFGVERGIYYCAKFLAQTSQNLWLASLFLIAGTGNRPGLDLSSLFLAMLLPSILLGLPGGAIADRLGPARGFATGAVLRFLPIAGALFFLDGGTSAWIFAFAYSTGSQVFTPAEMALVKPLQHAQAGRVHSWLVALQYGGQGTGMLVLAPALYFLGGPRLMLAGAATGFLVLTAMTVLLAWRLAPVAVKAPQSVASAMRFGDTVRFFRSEYRARYALVALGLKMVVAKGIVVALPFYLERDLGLGFGGLAYLMVPGVAGVVAGLLWCGRSLTLDRANDVMRLAILGLVVSVAALAALDYGITAVAQLSHVPPVIRLEAEMNTTFAVAIPVAFLLGLCLSGVLIAARVALTETAPLGQQARVFAVQLTLTESFIALPLLLMGVGTTFAGARPTLGVLALVLVAAFALAELDRWRSTSRRPLPAPALPETAAA
jgi:hypothetical protein